MNCINIKTKIYSGDNSLSHLREMTNLKIWIICDSFLVKNKSIVKILKELDDSNQVSIFDEVIPDPPIKVIGKGVAKFTKLKPDVVIAFGGGSAIDTAKGILYIIKENDEYKHVKFIAIPTTSGTGSEVTSVTIIADPEENTKYSIFDDCMLPDTAILDSDLTLTVPPVITANTGFDVLTHALEAYVGKNANHFSDALAEKAVELVMSSLLNCYYTGTDKVHRRAMQEASTLAGTAFNIAGLGISHSIAHQLGGTFKIPHGLANAIALPEVIKYNLKDNRAYKKYAKMAYKTGMAEMGAGNEFAVNVLQSYIKQIKKLMNMTSRLSEYGISKFDFNEAKSSMVVHALKDNCTNTNPVIVSEQDLSRLLENIY